MTNVIFMGSPPPVGFGFSEFAIAGAYATPIVSLTVTCRCSCAHVVLVSGDFRGVGWAIPE